MNLTDNQIYAVLFQILNEQLPCPVIQNFQPTQQGTPTESFITIHKIGGMRYGYPDLNSVYDEAAGDFETTETVWSTPTFQVTGKAIQDPRNQDDPTASDLAQMASDVLQSRATRQTLLQSGIGIIRIQDIRHVYFFDDRDRHEQEPSFDFTLSYKRTTATRRTARVQNVDSSVNRV